MALAEHKPYSPLQPDGSQRFHSPVMKTVQNMPERILVIDTDQGVGLVDKVNDLRELVKAYRNGELKEQF